MKISRITTTENGRGIPLASPEHVRQVLRHLVVHHGGNLAAAQQAIDSAVSLSSAGGFAYPDFPDSTNGLPQGHTIMGSREQGHLLLEVDRSRQPTDTEHIPPRVTEEALADELGLQRGIRSITVECDLGESDSSQSDFELDCGVLARALAQVTGLSCKQLTAITGDELAPELMAQAQQLANSRIAWMAPRLSFDHAGTSGLQIVMGFMGCDSQQPSNPMAWRQTGRVITGPRCFSPFDSTRLMQPGVYFEITTPGAPGQPPRLQVTAEQRAEIRAVAASLRWGLELPA